MKTLFRILCLILLTGNFNQIIVASDDDGKKLFKENCGSCHELGRVLTGPDLTGITDLRPEDWLISFIRNSKKLIENGDPIAAELYNQYNKVDMPENSLSDQDISSILRYIENYEDISVPRQSTTTPEVSIASKKKVSGALVLLITPLIILFFWIVFSMLISRKETDFSLKIKALNQFLKKRVVISFWMFISVLYLLISTIYASGQIKNKNESRKLNLTQEIEFSHKIHYSDYQIDCIYCHVKAIHTTQANLPGIQNCMKCHDYIRKGENTKEQEINKVIEYQKSGLQIFWKKGYRLPDHVHFDHALHTVAAGINCLKCHTNSDNPVISKKSIHMSWCLDCHAELTVNKQLNYYKKAFDTIQLSSESYVNDVGGIDCNKCHY